MKPHLRYLRYVLLHKWFVFIAGIQINGWRPGWVWRLLVHDLSKFRPSEWRPYAAFFYRPLSGLGATEALVEQGRLKRAFDEAWLKHQHRNPHHWQYWVLREDSGTMQRLLVPPVDVVDEMVADWLGAGTKVLSLPSFPRCVAETVKWYAANHEHIQLRSTVRARVEQILVALCDRVGLLEHAKEVRAVESARTTLLVRAPIHGGLGRVEQAP